MISKTLVYFLFAVLLLSRVADSSILPLDSLNMKLRHTPAGAINLALWNITKTAVTDERLCIARILENGYSRMENIRNSVPPACLTQVEYAVTDYGRTYFFSYNA